MCALAYGFQIHGVPRTAGQRLDPTPRVMCPPPPPSFTLMFRLLERTAGQRQTIPQKYVYLTDGGHFDNMGLYEFWSGGVAIRIIICDAEEDNTYIYDGIGASYPQVPHRLRRGHQS